MAEILYKHLIVTNNSTSDRYTNPSSFPKEHPVFSIDRSTYGNELYSELEEIERVSDSLISQVEQDLFYFQPGIQITFESWKDFDLKFESLEDARAKIEIVSIKEEDNKFFVTVRVPEGKLKIFFKKIEEFLDQSKDSLKGNPKNYELIFNIEKIKLSTLQSFWLDSEPFPKELNRKYFLEVWLRVGEDRNEIITYFKNQASKINISVSQKYLIFPENTVFFVCASMSDLMQSILILDCLSEIRISRDTPASFIEMTPLEEKEWVFELEERVSYHQNHKDIAVCILDTGVNYSHPLLKNSISENDTDSYNPDWGKTDHEGHGTEMAGLALYGELFPLLISNSSIILNHSLESIKILPPQSNNPEELYGVITEECIARAELLGTYKKRFFNMAITSSENKIIKGEPTSWSATIDKLAFGNQESKEPKRLFFISAGNLEYNKIKEYPSSNEIESVQNPAQAWNCITVGAFTEKVDIERSKHPNVSIIANKGDLSPTSTTSILWKEWPIKPDIVMEGGNYVKDNNNFVSKLDSLSLLTTNADFNRRLLTITGDTSAATAQASRYAALISSEYPNFWEETIRGVIIHSANYKKLNYSYKIIQKLKQQNKLNILRKFGYGFPDLNKALNSGKNYCTLIIQDELQPFIKEGSDIKTDEIKYYKLPIPSQALNQIPTESIELKVTLSYFIEPNPKRFNAKLTNTYSSCNLRFNSKSATETIEEFKKRINKNNRDALVDGTVESDFSDSENKQWVFGKKLRSYGSIHSDVWIGSAAQLVNKDSICVYPINGWWKSRKKLERYNNKIRFSLIISIESKNSHIDIYNEIANIIQIPNLSQVYL